MSEKTSYNEIAWRAHLERGLKLLLDTPSISETLGGEHLEKTPQRFTSALMEYLSGHLQDPKEVLQTGFTEKTYNQMVFENDIPFISHCAHHIAPFFGKAHFAYIPRNKVVGLSKIPRMIEILSRRLQIQEKLSDEIVNTFYEVVEPLGCGVVIEAVHFCVCARGIRKVGAYTRTTSLRGTFLEEAPVKAEFLAGAKPNTGGSFL